MVHPGPSTPRDLTTLHSPRTSPHVTSPLDLRCSQVHPGPSTHAALATLVNHALASMCGGRKRGARELLPRLASESTLQPAFEVAGFEICLGGREKTDLVTSRGGFNPPAFWCRSPTEHPL